MLNLMMKLEKLIVVMVSSLFAFHFQNSSVFMKNNGHIATICMH